MKVELVSYTPNPVESCGRAAGICYDKEQKEDYGSFIKRIISYGHMDVIEHANFTFRVEGISRACSHQLVRHRHSSFSQRSQRYVSEKESSFILPSLEYVSPEKREEASSVMREYIKRSYEVYASLIKLGVKKEDARFVLTNAAETRLFWTTNARSLRHFFVMRLDISAQWEIRDLARLAFDEVIKVAPALFDDLLELRNTGHLGHPIYE
ncbi:MAG: FAD-dependent thymidylate synthase [Candidatus Thermoplasmatota archaeon]|nr:FAD-dependent thymidylate synthase [Candidatus Sysuiplasma jiujiangense]MBX8638913.1 FAD-dependent thymidylate synthase [Candidatus Sysuiplasma jiujiangense]MBX8641026.1 FAD-dependent thymidylate synthase [Candidatus Sysuiplasma jiujiangense]MCL4317060.1 FAD-dependent thymidylate synthase [Candidatus Thermoplasmatota archaeon]MCL5253103.1 FAD-dependent thymidylate synthase [Candidatus Thermoplasmatota archaeon]